MAVADIHVPYAVKFNTTVIGGITRQSLSPGVTVRGQITDGGVFRREQSIGEIASTAEFAGQALTALFGQVGTVGVSIASLTSGFFVIYEQAVAEGGTRAGATSHRSHTFREGLVIPRTLSCRHNGDAELTCSVIASYDGTNEISTIATGLTLPTIANNTERFGLGPVTLESIAFAEVTSLDVDFGLNVVATSTDGEVRPTFVHIETGEPTIRIRGIKSAWFAASGSIPTSGLAISHANTAIWLRQRANGGIYTADASSAHIKITAAGIATIATAADGSGSSPLQIEVMIRAQHDGTNNPVIVTTGQVIP